MAVLVPEAEGADPTPPNVELVEPLPPEPLVVPEPYYGVREFSLKGARFGGELWD